MRKAQKWQFVKLYEGLPSRDCMELQTEDIPALEDGDVLFEAIYISFDPYSGLILNAAGQTNVTVIGLQIAKVTESRDENYKVGDLYQCSFGWRTHTVINPGKGEDQGDTVTTIRPVPDTGDLPVSLTLGALGLPGISAYIGLLDSCDPKPGETVFISSAAGVVGSMAGQIAKIKGCRVIGSAGSAEKVAWLKDLGFDEVFNYKSCDLSAMLKQYAPDGIDIYIENVGGEFGLNVICDHMAAKGRVSVIGSIATYTKPMEPQSYDIIKTILLKALKVYGFLSFTEDRKKYEVAAKELIQWAKEGKLRWKENVLKGFDNMRENYIKFMAGTWSGKTVVKIADIQTECTHM